MFDGLNGKDSNGGSSDRRRREGHSHRSEVECRIGDRFLDLDQVGVADLEGTSGMMYKRDLWIHPEGSGLYLYLVFLYFAWRCGVQQTSGVSNSS